MPSNRTADRRGHRTIRVVVLFITVIGLGLMTLSAILEGKATKEFLLLVIAIAAVIIPDRCVDIITSYFDDKREEESSGRTEEIIKIMNQYFGSLSSHLLGAHDIIAFPTRIEGLEHCIYLAKHASHIRNTALRYGQISSLGNTIDPDEVDKVYLQWIEEKKRTLLRGCSVTEIISRYFSSDDPMRQFAENERSGHYASYCIDDRLNPMVQVTIFEFEGRRPPEIVMGWEIPGKEEGLSFASRHRDIVSYFEAYFNHNVRINTNTTWQEVINGAQSGGGVDAEASGAGSAGSFAPVGWLRNQVNNLFRKNSGLNGNANTDST
ncbi:MAG: hypothetical protein JWR80_9663 [Bradyrhizobium sp.]|nr:hypothetical protein [Bradyrhizobium sp.]